MNQKTKINLLIFTLAFLVLGMFPPRVAAFGDDGDGNNLDIIGNAIKGDLILTHGGKFGGVIPGYYDHSAIYIGWSYHYDSQAGYAKWDYYVVEAIDQGVVYSAASRLNLADEAVLLRVSGANSWHRDRVVEYAEAYANGAWESSWFSSSWEWGETTEYDYNYLYGMSTYGSMYCSELACKAWDWALDGAPGNPWDYDYDNSDGNSNSIDDNPGWSGWDYYWACAPSELYDSSLTYEIAHGY